MTFQKFMHMAGCITNIFLVSASEQDKLKA